MRAVIAHDSADGLRTWELIEADLYFLDRVWGLRVHGQWASGPTKMHVAFPVRFVQVVA